MNWETLIRNWNEASHEYPLVVGQPANHTNLDELTEVVSRELPEEFVNLYSCYNGVGIRIEGKSEWAFMPTTLLPAFITETRDWFEETHPSLAPRFFPFFNWGTGDAVGYLWDENGRLIPGLYEFSHEFYEFKVGQNWDEFMIKSFDSIEEFIIATTP